MTKAILVMVALLVGLSGCASHRPSAYSVNGQETLVGWTNQAKLPANAYYVLLEGSPDEASWTVREVYNRPISGRSNNNQEILFVDKEFRYVQPYFEINESTVVKVGESSTMNLVGRTNSNGQVMVTGADVYTSSSYLDRGSWECGAFFQSNRDKYTPCTTRLTKTDVGRSIGKNIFAVLLTLGTMSGTHQVVDKDKIADIVTKTDLFAKIKASSAFSPEVSAQ
jgi:hypothetical protein